VDSENREDKIKFKMFTPRWRQFFTQTRKTGENNYIVCNKTMDHLYGQSSWLQIRRPGFDSRHYQKKNSGSGTGSTQPEELLDRKVAVPV
jgi:hypothetical protein